MVVSGFGVFYFMGFLFFGGCWASSLRVINGSFFLYENVYIGRFVIRVVR